MKYTQLTAEELELILLLRVLGADDETYRAFKLLAAVRVTERTATAFAKILARGVIDDEDLAALQRGGITLRFDGEARDQEQLFRMVQATTATTMTLPSVEAIADLAQTIIKLAAATPTAADLANLSQATLKSTDPAE